MLGYGERRVFLLGEVLDEVRCGPVIARARHTS
jgi:hypothetical protein